jgi:hypothetical protein
MFLGGSKVSYLSIDKGVSRDENIDWLNKNKWPVC